VKSTRPLTSPEKKANAKLKQAHNATSKRKHHTLQFSERTWRLMKAAALEIQSLANSRTR